MVEIPKTYPPVQPEAIASFNFTSILTGNSYIVFNAGVATSSQAVYESYTTGDDANSANANNSGDRIAQTFTVGNTGTDAPFYVVKIRVKTNGSNYGTNTVAEIQETTAGEPNGVVKLRLKNPIKVIELGANDWWEFNLNNVDAMNGSILEVSTQYALVVYSDAAGSVTVRKDDNDATYTGGAHWTTPDSGANWTEQTGDDLLFEIRGNLINPYVLTSATLSSAFNTTTVGVSSPASTDIDTETGRVIFEGQFNKSATINGVAFVNYTFASGSDNVVSEAEVWHVRGTVETKLGDAEGLLDDKTPTLQMDLIRTSIIPGDRIKLKLIFNYLEVGTINTSATLNHSGTNLTLNIPFVSV